MKTKKRKPQKRVRSRRLQQPQLRFTPWAWAKLVWLRDRGPTEIGGLGIAPSDDPLLVEDIRLVKQTTTLVSVAFDDESVADLFDELVDEGLRPEQFARVWIHTHPGDSAHPSGVDEETFARCFGTTDWAVMFILAQGGETYGRLQFHVGPSGTVPLETEIAWSEPFGVSDPAAWDSEYRQHVRPREELSWYVEDWESLVAEGVLTLEEYNQLKEEAETDANNIHSPVLAASGFDPGSCVDADFDQRDWSGSDWPSGGFAVDGDRSDEHHADRL